MKNIMSVDLEDYYCDLPFDKWEKKIERTAVMTPDMKQALKQMNQSLHISSKSILTEREGNLSIVDVLLNDNYPEDTENE